MPLLPAAAAAMAVLLFRVRKPGTQYIIAAVVAFALLQSVWCSVSGRELDARLARFFGWSNYCGSLPQEDPYRIRQLRQALGDGAADDGQLRVLMVVIDDRYPFPFETRYRLRLLDRRVDLRDILISYDAGFCLSADAVVFKVPYGAEEREWRSWDHDLRHAKCRLVARSETDTPLDQVLESLYTMEGRCARAVVIRVPAAGFSWLVYRRTERKMPVM
jgi:hypothetical protein